MMTVAVLSGLGVFSFLMLLLFCDVLTEAVAGGGALSVLLEISMPLLSCCFGLRTQASGFVLWVSGLLLRVAADKDLNLQKFQPLQFTNSADRRETHSGAVFNMGNKPAKQEKEEILLKVVPPLDPAFVRWLARDIKRIEGFTPKRPRAVKPPDHYIEFMRLYGWLDLDLSDPDLAPLFK
ncbi:hypothetical protein Ancab_011303 [Ancistrocladus abbreviatus]